MSPSQRQPLYVAVFAALVCFAAYACIISFRKAFNVASFEGHTLWGLDYKTILVITQGIGYLLSKFYGIRFISELKRIGRGRLILLLVGIAWMAWLLFALLPPPYNFWVLLINGFPLGMLWGVLFSYVEGRRATDFIGAALAVSFIFGPGLAKSVGQWVMLYQGVSEYWMPFVTSLIFFIPLLLFVYLLEKIPAPSEADVEHRTQRLPMGPNERKYFLTTFLPGIVFLVVIYMFVTVLREIRDSFMADMWKASGEDFNAGVFARTETLISIVLLGLIAAMVIIRNNMRAFVAGQLVMLAGFALSGIITWLYLSKSVNTFSWMTLVGMGLYMTYIPFNSMLFDRMIAAFRYVANAGFLIYVADSFGYLASIGVLLSRSMLRIEADWLEFYTRLVIITSIIGTLLVIASLIYFKRKRKIFLKG